MRLIFLFWKILYLHCLNCKCANNFRRYLVLIIFIEASWLTDYSGMSTHLKLLYAKRLENNIHRTFISIWLRNCFMRGIFWRRIRIIFKEMILTHYCDSNWHHHFCPVWTCEKWPWTGTPNSLEQQTWSLTIRWRLYHRTNVLCCKKRSSQKKKYSNSKVREENIAVVFIQLWLLQLEKFIYLRPSSPFLSVVTGCGWELAVWHMPVIADRS